MKVTNYEEWNDAISAEYAKLTEVSLYLNDKGRERMDVFGTLENLACFCATAAELLIWIDRLEDLDKCNVTHLQSDHASLPIATLRRIVKSSEK